MKISEIVHKIPFIRIIIPFMLGIAIARYSMFRPDLAVGVVLSTAVAFALMLRFKRNWLASYHYRWVMGVAVSVILFLVGFMLYKAHEGTVSAVHAERDVFMLEVVDAPANKPRSMMVMARVLSSASDTSINAKVLCYLEKDSLSQQLSYGDRLMAVCQFDSIEESNIPYAFNYAWWMRKQHVVSQTYIRAHEWVLVDNQGGNGLGRLSHAIRNHVISVFQSSGINNKGQALLSALLVGDKQYIDPEQKLSFQRAGVLHVLAVSGLHVGILYLFISGMLVLLQRNKWLRILRSLIIWLVLIVFAMVAGLSPSVIRAALMFFLFDLGSLLSKRSSVYNIIASSAFVIILIDPHTMFEAGFWLSYCAVISIITFFPFVTSLVPTRFMIVKKLRDLLALSISVQPGTAALSVYLFNQFPVWFLLSNIVAVPAVGLIIYLAFSILILDLFSLSWQWMFTLLQAVLDALDWFLTLVSNLPFAIIENIGLSGFEMVLLMTTGILLGWMLWMKERKTLIPILVVINIFLGMICFRSIHNKRTTELIAFSHYQSAGVFLKSGDRGIWIQPLDSAVSYNALSKYQAIKGIQHIENIPSNAPVVTDSMGQFFVFTAQLRKEGLLELGLIDTLEFSGLRTNDALNTLMFVANNDVELYSLTWQNSRFGSALIPQNERLRVLPTR